MSVKKRHKDLNTGRKNWIISVGLFLLGCFLLFCGFFYAVKEKSMNQWLMTTGIVEKTDKYQYARGKSSLVFYGLRVDYKYRVNGILYRSSQAIRGGNYESTLVQDVNQLKQKYQNQKQIKVFYNPQNPAESILINKGLNEVVYFNYFAGGFILILLSVIINTSNIIKLFKRTNL